MRLTAQHLALGAIFAASIALAPTQRAAATELPAGFVDEVAVSGLAGQVTGFDQSRDGRLFVAEKSGIVRVVVNGVLNAEPFIDLSAIVNDRVDRGLLSIALHPAFPGSPYVYLLYTYDPPDLMAQNLVGPGGADGNGNRVARLERFTADATRSHEVASAGSGVVLLGRNSTLANIGDPEGNYDTDLLSCGPIGNPLVDCLPIDELSHTIGALRFADDGALIVTNGDGASYHNVAPVTFEVQNLDSLRGKILRIDPETGNGLADNPWFDGDPDGNRSRVLATGLRNPYSLALHPQTGVPYTGDVGWKGFEEISGGWGKNFGWPCYAGAPGGNARHPDFESEAFCADFYNNGEPIEPPVVSWVRGEGGAAMVGDFYRGDAFPETYQGALFYGDYVQGWLRSVRVPVATRSDGQGMVTSEALDATASAPFATDMPAFTEIRSLPDGALYYASISTGEIRRIRFAGTTDSGTSPDVQPTSGSTPTPTSGSTPTSTSGSTTASTPPSAPASTSGSTSASTPGDTSGEQPASGRVSVGASGLTSIAGLLLGLMLSRGRSARK